MDSEWNLVTFQYSEPITVSLENVANIPLFAIDNFSVRVEVSRANSVSEHQRLVLVMLTRYEMV